MSLQLTGSDRDRPMDVIEKTNLIEVDKDHVIPAVELYCPNCGKKLHAKKSRCQDCGQKLNWND